MGPAKDTLRRPTVLVCDLVASTAIAESIGDEPLWDLLLEYQDACSEVIHKYGGTVYKRLGDGLLALFGIPRAHDDDALRAVHSGLALVAAVRQLSKGAREKHGVELALRVGIHTGDVMVGRIDGSLEVAGFAVHQADRLQSHAEENGVIVSGATAGLLGDHFTLRMRGEVDLRGVTEATLSYDVLGARDPMDATTVEDPIAMVGRSAERAVVGEAWKSVMAGEPRALLITGEAGIGKSRLARFARDHAARAGGVPLEGECSPYHADVPFYVIGRMLLRHLAQDPDVDRAHRLSGLAEMVEAVGLDPGSTVPLMAPLIAVEVGDDDGYAKLDLTPAEVGEATESAIRDWWARAAGQEARAFLIEDLHHADPSTLALLQRLIEEGLPSGMFLIMTGKPDVSMAGIGPDGHLELAPLPNDEAREFLTAIAEVSDISEDDLIERSGGNPLFLRELARAMGGSEGNIPGSLRDLLMARLDDSGDLELAQVAAAIGSDVDPELLAEIVGNDAEARVDRLVESGVLARHTDHEGHRLRFSQQLLRDTAYESMPSRERRSIHSRLADSYLADDSGLGRASVTALHLDRAGRYEEAAAAYLAAADTASSRGAFSEALRHLRYIQDLSDEHLPPESGAELRRVAILRSSFVLVAKEGFGSEAASAQAARALELAPEGSLAETAGPRITAFAQATILGQRAEAKEIISALELDLIGAPESDRIQVEAEIVSSHALHEFGLGHYTDSRHKFERGLTLYHGAPRHGAPWADWPLPTSLPATSNAQLIPIYWVQGDRSLSEAASVRAKQAADSLDPPMDAFNRAYTVGYMGWVALLDGAFSTARDALREQGEIGREHGFAMWESLADALLAIADAQLEPSIELADRMTVARERAANNTGSSFQPYMIAAEGEVRMRGGDKEGALALLDQSIALSESTSEFIYLPETYRIKALALADDMELAREMLDAAVSLASSQDAHVYRLRALLGYGDLPDAQQPDGLGGLIADALRAMAEPETYREHERALELVAASG